MPPFPGAEEDDDLQVEKIYRQLERQRLTIYKLLHILIPQFTC